MADDMLELKFPDVPDVIGRMQSLDTKVKRRIARRATLAGIRVLRDRARENAAAIDDPATKEQISRNIAVKFSSRLGKQSGGVAYKLGVRGGAKQYVKSRLNKRKGRAGKTYETDGSAKNPGGNTWYWRFVEFGTKRARGRGIFRRTLNQGANDAINMATQTALKLIDEALKENGGK